MKKIYIFLLSILYTASLTYCPKPEHKLWQELNLSTQAKKQLNKELNFLVGAQKNQTASQEQLKKILIKECNENPGTVSNVAARMTENPKWLKQHTAEFFRRV